MYKLSKNHFSYHAGHAPVLVSDDGASGPYDKNCELAFASNSTASAYVQRVMLGEPLPGDPSLSVDKGANLQAYCWEYLTFGTPGEVFEFAEFYHKLKTRGIKIPDLG